jgi:hypothetical protein
MFFSFPAGVIWKSAPQQVPPPGAVLYRLPSRPWAMMPEYAGLFGSPLLLPKLYKTEKVCAWTTPEKNKNAQQSPWHR